MVRIENAQMQDLDRLMELEVMAFPPSEAAVRETFAYRLEYFSQWFRKVIIDGEIMAYTCSRPVEISAETGVEDWMYDCEECPKGDTVILQAIGTHTDYRRKGIGGELIQDLISKCREAGTKRIILACKEEKVHYYAKFGFEKMGLSASQHGGAVWYDMEMYL